jgi:RNA polymerase sigma-70 factor (ECF subfamily)
VHPEELALTPVPASSLRDDRWFETLFREHYPRVVGLLTRLTGDPAQSEEIAADAFSKLSRHPLPFGGQCDLAAWVYRVASNAGLDALRAGTRRRRKEEAAGAERLRTEAEPHALEMLLREERARRVRTVLSALKPRDAQLLLLRTSGLSYREIAQALGMAASSVGTTLVRAEREFERRYRARYGDDV